MTLPRLGQKMATAMWRGWSRIWFQSRSTVPLEIARIGIGAALLVNYGLATPYLFEFWGEAGWMPRKLALENAGDPWVQSILFYVSAAWQLAAFHALFLLCCAAFLVGWRTRWVKWVVWIGEISYAARNPILVYGVDQILCSLLFLLCLAPTGSALSLDRVRAVRIAKRNDIAATLPPYRSVWTGACTRLMQI